MEITHQDIERESLELLTPQGPTPLERETTVFLSNIDQTVAFPVETIFFFKAAPDQTLKISHTVKNSVLEVISSEYSFMAGRLSPNPNSNRLELLCNNAGVPFCSSLSRLSVEDLGDVSNPNPSFQKLVLRTDAESGKLSPATVFTVQVTKFACGGFSLGFVTNHSILDGKSAAEMFSTIAAVCRGEKLKLRGICNDRSCLRARNPPRIDYEHEEYMVAPPPSSFTPPGKAGGAATGGATDLRYRVFPFSTANIQQLKSTAGECSTFEVLVAHIWRARTRALGRGQKSTVVFAVDMRSRMASPPLPEGFVGNAVAAAAAADDVADKPLSYCVERIRAAISRVTDSYIRSAIDWLEVNRGLPAIASGGFFISAWWKLPFHELDFGYGKPLYGGPVASPMAEFVLLLHGGGADDHGGVNVWIMMDEERMKKLEVYMADI